jgi:DNA-binding Lrp family transcriptional regulator
MPEVMEFYRMAGDVDYVLRVVVADMQAYDIFYKKLIGAAALFSQGDQRQGDRLELDAWIVGISWESCRRKSTPEALADPHRRTLCM